MRLVRRDQRETLAELSEGGMIERSFRMLAVPFGGPIFREGAPNGVDLDQEWFSERTELRIGPHSQVPVLFHHDRDPSGRVQGRLGTALNWTRTPKGWVADVELDDSPNVRLVQRLSERTDIYGSTSVEPGAPVRRDHTGEILYWPVHELSLSPSPQNVMAITLQPFRSNR